MLKPTFFKPLPAGNQNSKTLKNDEHNKHIPVLDIAKNKSALISGIAEIWRWKKYNVIWVSFEIMQCEMVFWG